MHVSAQKNDRYWLSFFFLFPCFFLKMATTCCFCLFRKAKTTARKTRPPPIRTTLVTTTHLEIIIGTGKKGSLRKGSLFTGRNF